MNDVRNQGPELLEPVAVADAVIVAESDDEALTLGLLS